MNEQQDIKAKILYEAETLFMKYGFKSITMDDVARELGVSKKTLYQYFTDKNDLVNQCVDSHLDIMKNGCIMIMEPKADPVVSMLQISDFVGKNIRQLNPSSMYDLKKYFKSAWDKVDAYRKEFIATQITENIESGKKKGLYRKDVDTETIVMIYVYLVDFLINPETHASNFDFNKMHQEIIKYHLRAICTPKGLEVMEEQLKNKK